MTIIRFLAITVAIVVLIAPGVFAQQCNFSRTITAQGQGVGPTPQAAKVDAQADLNVEIPRRTATLQEWANQQKCDYYSCGLGRWVGQVVPSNLRTDPMSGYNATKRAYVVDLLEDLSITVECFKRKNDDRIFAQVGTQGPTAIAQAKATELRSTVSQLSARNLGLKNQFQQTISIAEGNLAKGNHVGAAQALTSIAETVFRTPDNQLSQSEKIAVLRSLDQSWRRMEIKVANPHAIHEGCRCSLRSGRCVEDPEGGECSEGRNAEGRWSCASSP